MISTSENAAKIKLVTDKMTRGLNKSLGLDTTNPTNEDNTKKKKAALIELLEHNTIQIVHMLFAKPRDIWYSPDMRNGTLSPTSKWSFFRLDKPEIVTKSAFKLLKEKKWDAAPAPAPAAASTRLDYILDKSLPASSDTVYEIEMVKDTTFKNNRLETDEKSLCSFIVASQPSPQMIDPSKDSANESRFQLPSFNAALGSLGESEGEPAVNDDHNVGAKMMDKLTGLLKPDPEKCSNVRNLLQEQASEISTMTADIVKSAGVDFTIKSKQLLDDINNRFKTRIKASLAAAENAVAEAAAAVEGLKEIVAAAAAAEATGTAPIVITNATDAEKAAKKANEGAKEKAAESHDTKTPKELEKIADDVKVLEIDAIKQSQIAVDESKRIRDAAFQAIKMAVEKLKEKKEGDIKTEKDKKTLESIYEKIAFLNFKLSELSTIHDKSNDPVKGFIADISRKNDELTALSLKIRDYYSDLDTELKKIVVGPLTADSPSAEFEATVKTSKAASSEITNKIGELQAEIAKANSKVQECNDLINQINTEIAKIDKDAADIKTAIAAAAAAAVAAETASQKANTAAVAAAAALGSDPTAAAAVSAAVSVAVTAAAGSRRAADEAAKATTLKDANTQKDEAEKNKVETEKQLTIVKGIAAAAAAAVAALQKSLMLPPPNYDNANLLQQIQTELAKLPPAGLD
jgi:hypothetical protein